MALRAIRQAAAEKSKEDGEHYYLKAFKGYKADDTPWHLKKENIFQKFIKNAFILHPLMKDKEEPFKLPSSENLIFEHCTLTTDPQPSIGENRHDVPIQRSMKDLRSTFPPEPSALTTTGSEPEKVFP